MAKIHQQTTNMGGKKTHFRVIEKLLNTAEEVKSSGVRFGETDFRWVVSGARR